MIKPVKSKTKRDALLGNLDEALRSAYKGVAEGLPDDTKLNEIRNVEINIFVQNEVDIPDVQVVMNRLPDRVYFYAKEKQND